VAVKPPNAGLPTTNKQEDPRMAFVAGNPFERMQSQPDIER